MDTEDLWHGKGGGDRSLQTAHGAPAARRPHHPDSAVTTAW